MKINDRLYGFTVTDVCDVSPIDAKMLLMEHDKTGAKLCFLKRQDASRTFSITFPTIPTDDTGVFHILEHSVLCGSEKFPTKEPFTELLKGSLNTFLNAMTYSDRTCYPVASRNDKDFYNLVDVYLDAVFNPNAVKEERIFRQEGWRYEVDGEGEIGYNGVVYSEMKGVYSSADSIAAYHNARLLFPGGTYSYDSGGHPDAITDLTYEDFVTAHKKYYHPSGAYIFLDGEPKLDEILPLVDSYLSRYERRDMSFDIERGDDVVTEPLYERYEIEDGEDPTDKTRLYLTYITREFSDTGATVALSVITDAIADSNEAPLKRAVLESGLCDNMYLYHSPGCYWGTLNVEFRGVKDGCENELIRHFDKCFEEMIRSGIDRALLEASCDRLEFKAREADFGSTPKGIVYLSAINDLWIYGMHPSLALDHEKSFTELREAIATDYPEKLLGDILATPRATLVLTPSKELAAEREDALSVKLDAKISAMDEAERGSLAAKSAEFTEWQSREDTPDQLATIPTLKLSDLGNGPDEVPTIVDKNAEFTLIDHPIATGGISYVDMYFDATDLDADGIYAMTVLSLAYPNLDTKRGSANDFRRRSKSALGSLSVTLLPTKRTEDARLYLLVRFSCLDTRRDDALELIKEYILEAIINNPAAIKRTIVQKTAIFSDLFTESGHALATLRAAASYSSFEAMKEYVQGYELYRRLKANAGCADDEIACLIEKIESLYKKITVRDRLTLSLTGKQDPEYSKRCAMAFPSGAPAGDCAVKPLPRRNEGIAIPAQISYAALACNLAEAGYASEARDGAWSTLATILDFEILWEEVRVKGGAYGSGFSERSNSATAVYYSYRDPSPKRSIGIYKSAPAMLRERIDGGLDLEKLIIGTIGASEPVTTPALDGSAATLLYLSDISEEDVKRRRRECIATTEDKLRELSEKLDTAMGNATVTVVGPRDQLMAMGLDEILEI